MKDRLLIIGSPEINKHSLLPIVTPGEYNDDSIQKLTLKTKYYTTDINVWIDHVNDWNGWSDLFQSDEAEEVRDVLNGVILCFSFHKGQDHLKEVLGSIQGFIDKLKGDDFVWDGVMCCVGFGGTDSFECFEDICLSSQWECVDIESKVERNEYSEPLGKLKFKQVVESNEWVATEEQTVEPSMELDELIEKMRDAKSEIASLPERERHQRALDILRSLNFIGFDPEELKNEPLV
jgi:hypothetical protein